MTPNKTEIKDFFQGEKQYTIPVYQRAYSWEEKQWKDFLADLEEATKGNNQYFFGNVLLELNTADKTNDIIDGQQRITTIIIFARALCNVLQNRAKNETLSSERNNEDFLKYIEENYLINRPKAKLQAVEYDRDYFKDVIICNDEKIAWIENYVKELKNAFINFKEFENSQSVYGEYLIYLKVSEVYPFILKAYTMFKDRQQLEQVFQALEIIAFRDKLVRTRADLASRLNSVLKNFDSVEKLVSGLQEICSDNNSHWRDEVVKESLRNIYKENKNIIPYLLARYENYLRKQDSKTKCYSFVLREIEESQIEHIAPQTENGERLSSGYCEYDKDFYENHYLHCIGNLILIGQSHNIAIGNKPFQEKLASYENSPLIQQKEIKDFAINGKWEKKSIDERHEKLEKFVLTAWSY